MNVNNVAIAGNITRDIEMKFTPGGMGIASFGVAINRKFKDKSTGEMREDVTFVDCDAFGKTAEAMHKYLAKGSPVYLEGRLKLDSWEDKQTGQKRSKLKVVVENFQFVGSKSDGASKPVPAKKPATVPADDDENNLDVQEENIPF